MHTRRYPTLRLLLLVSLTLLLLAGCRRQSDPPAPPAQADSATLKITIAEDGMVRLTLAQLQQAGMEIEALTPETVALTTGGDPVPLLIDGDALIFYGRKPDNRYNQHRPYLLQSGTPGLALETRPLATDNIPDTAITTVIQTLHLEENHIYEQRAASDGGIGDGGVWFWHKLLHSGNNSRFTVTADLPAVGPGSAEIRLRLYGLTYSRDVNPDHDLDLIVNDQLIERISFDGQIYHESSSLIPPGVLRPGPNTITLNNNQPDATIIDQMYLDAIVLHYPALPRAANDRLVAGQLSGQLTLDGFSATPRLFEISDPDRPRLLEGGQGVIGTNGVVLPVSADMVIAAIGPDGYHQPAALTPLTASDWRNPANQADILIVTTRELAPALAPLVAARAAQGLTAVVAPIDELYDTFAWGDTTPLAIQSFVRHAVETWADPKPRYLFLVGEATTDTLGYLSRRPENPVPFPRNHVPSLLIGVRHSGETVSDARLADVTGDLRPDLAVGRWPVDSAAAVRDLVARTLAYEQAPAAAGALFAWDNSGGSTEFAGFTQRLVTDAGFNESNAILYEGPTSSQMAARWNEGVWLVNYTGHGSLEMWGKDEHFSAGAVRQLSANKQVAPPIVTQFSCLTGQFAHPGTRSISETLLQHPGGPVLLVAATSLTVSSHQSPLAIALMEALRDPAIERMGDALQQAKNTLDIEKNSGLQEISDTFLLIGDPSARIVRPATP
jgi:hypothetical protein